MKRREATCAVQSALAAFVVDVVSPSRRVPNCFEHCADKKVKDWDVWAAAAVAV
jgi:hypothetical protein